MTFEWREKVVLITGASNGIGAEVVKILIDVENVKHVSILDIEDPFTEQKILSTAHNKNKVKHIKCDVTDDTQLFDGYKDVIDRYGCIDVVINNAGFMNDSLDKYKKEIELNVTALCTSSLKAIEVMRKDEGGQGGTIINISSICALIQHPLMPIYFGTKSAVLHFSNCIGLEHYYYRTGVRVITMCYGGTNTGLISAGSLASFDKFTNDNLMDILKEFQIQSPKSAAVGLIEAYKKGKSGSTWLAVKDKPVRDITENVTKAYEILSEGAI
ncbi:15-hydroxyprostaglandin dehydrogenase [NAD(+)]-like [Achroia grisella]|uniref:15-hydroxyprostaglandin dehydrogenase [NAD(+)]-like n=1 Tax=Achroia grisella TaxID=688607 RepID=UPI0027D2EF84|nr:15-hydroxyprostaglandin dehydrogenase [NAD(+)]-like [Achroia grisella]